MICSLGSFVLYCLASGWVIHDTQSGVLSSYPQHDIHLCTRGNDVFPVINADCSPQLHHSTCSCPG